MCPIHGVFNQRISKHMIGQGCIKCSKLYKPMNNEFIQKCVEVHNKEYDYSLVDYVNCKTDIKIICHIHGIFEQTPYSHLNGNGCPKCIGRNKTNNEFIKESKEVHRNKYDYSLTEYKGNRKKIKIICTEHGVFEQTPHNHLSGFGCFKCCQSKGEKEIRKLLERNNIKYITQKTFKECKNINKLKFDFYLPKYDTCIEYDGKQHFEPIKYFGGENSLKLQKIRDQIKNEYCKNNNIRLVCIKYNEPIKEKLNFL